MGFTLMAACMYAVQVGTCGAGSSSQQAAVGAMASSSEHLASQGWTDRVRLQVISKVRGSARRHPAAAASVS